MKQMDKVVTVNFDAAASAKLKWRFKPQQNRIRVSFLDWFGFLNLIAVEPHFLLSQADLPYN